MKTHLKGKNHKLLLTSVKEEREDVFRDNAVLSRSWGYYDNTLAGLANRWTQIIF